MLRGLLKQAHRGNRTVVQRELGHADSLALCNELSNPRFMIRPGPFNAMGQLSAGVIERPWRAGALQLHAKFMKIRIPVDSSEQLLGLLVRQT
jgi:hypothetical protein